MTPAHYLIGVGAAKLAARIPYQVLLGVAQVVAAHADVEWAAARRAVLESLPTPDFRDAVTSFFGVWGSAGVVGAEAVAMALVTAAESEREHRERDSVEIVWTGPEPEGSRFRHTEQALLEVLNTATRRLTVVSYAVYRIPRVQEALIAAVRRGVGIRLIVETPNLIEGQGEYDCLVALGAEVAAACAVYYWPQGNRAQDGNGKIGILHVKCAVADGRRLFLSSANMTDYAFTINMELGCLLTGGTGPETIERHFDQLVSNGTLVRLRPRQ